MNQFNFNQPGGMPLTTNILDGMQNAYRIFNQFANLIDRAADKKYIISGCEEVGTSITDGFVCIGNEILPLKGAPKQNNVFIKEIQSKRIFKDGSEKTVKVDRIVSFGTGSGSPIPWSEFKQLPDMREILEKIEDNAFSINSLRTYVDNKIGGNTSLINSLRTYVNSKVSSIQSRITNLAATLRNEMFTISKLRQHGEWQEVECFNGSSLTFEDPLKVRKMTNGLIHLKGYINPNESGDINFSLKDKEMSPQYSMSLIFSKGGSVKRATLRKDGGLSYFVGVGTPAYFNTFYSID